MVLKSKKTLSISFDAKLNKFCELFSSFFAKMLNIFQKYKRLKIKIV
jgi:hypothetical protein